jgi:hypothetical protein
MPGLVVPFNYCGEIGIVPAVLLCAFTVVAMAYLMARFQ